MFTETLSLLAILLSLLALGLSAFARFSEFEFKQSLLRKKDYLRRHIEYQRDIQHFLKSQGQTHALPKEIVIFRQLNLLTWWNYKSLLGLLFFKLTENVQSDAPLTRAYIIDFDLSLSPLNLLINTRLKFLPRESPTPFAEEVEHNE